MMSGGSQRRHDQRHATHEMGFAAHAADKIAFMDSSRIARIGASRRTQMNNMKPRRMKE